MFSCSFQCSVVLPECEFFISQQWNDLALRFQRLYLFSRSSGSLESTSALSDADQWLEWKNSDHALYNISVAKIIVMASRSFPPAEVAQLTSSSEERRARKKCRARC